MTALISWVLHREHQPLRVWLAIGSSIAGITIVMWGSSGGGNVVGDLWAVGAITTYALAAVILSRHRAVSRTVVVGLAGALMALFCAPFADFAPFEARTWLALIAMGAAFGPLARIMLGNATRHLRATEVALFAPLETMLATLWAFLAFDELPATQTWFGGAIVIAGLVTALAEPATDETDDLPGSVAAK